MYRYIVFDSSQHMRFSSRLDRLGAHYVSLFDGHPEEPFRDIAPLLIDVTSACELTQTVVEEATRIGLLKPCVSMLDSTSPLSGLADHLRRFHLFEMSDGRLMVTRWYDTRILPALFEILSPQQLWTFTQGIATWSGYGRFGATQEYRIHDDKGSERPLKQPTPLILDASQERTLFDATEPDFLIHELRRNIKAEIDRVPRDVLYPFIRTHWLSAREAGVTERADQLQFLVLALTTSGKCADCPIVIDRMKSGFAHNEESFQQWIENLPAEVWESGPPLWETSERAQGNYTVRSGNAASRPV